MISSSFKSKLSFKLSLIIMITSMLGVSVIAYISYLQSKEIFSLKNISAIEIDLQKYANSINDSTKSLKQNIAMLSQNRDIQGFLRAYENKYKYDEVQNKTLNEFEEEIKALFELMLKQNPSYFQVRIIDAKSGKELVRLDRKDKKIIIVKEDNLQNKLSREYMQEALKAKGGIYISKLNLNREFGKIEFPVKPTLRVAKMTSKNVQTAGVIVINVDASNLLSFNKSREDKIIKTYIANQEGYYLLNTNEPFKEFGFEYNRGYKIFDDFNELKELFNSDLDTYKSSQNSSILQAKKLYLESGRYIVAVKHTTDSLFNKRENDYFTNLLVYIVIIGISIAILTTFIVKKFTAPIINLKNIANKVAQTKGEKIVEIKTDSKDEIGELANSFNIMLKTLMESKKEIKEFAKKLEVEVENKTIELKKTNESLQKKVDEKLAEIRKKDQALLQQNKMAAIGETIGAIAHQWRQPLNSLGLNIQMLVDMAEDNKCSTKEIEKFVDSNMKTIQFMSQTIDDFRNFFRDSREKSKFSIKDAVNSTISLQQELIRNCNIKLITELDSIYITGYKNKFMQVILNLISNAKDAIISKQEEKPNLHGFIKIISKKENDYIVIEIIDNGISVDETIIEKIFEPYFTTKEQGKGTGMGLYMSKEIISSMNGELIFLKTNNEKKFVIRFKDEQND